MPNKLVGGYCTVGNDLFRFLPAYVLAHPFPCSFWRQNQRPPIVYINEAFIRSRGHYEKSLGFIAALKRRTADRRHEYRLPVGPIDLLPVD
ncbi:Uncharacterised protein [Enterobacter hormaechei]|nr:hypothetical protein AI2865V1_1926 [Enterobacter cloacae]CZU83369.1 Uncharacterised protein [Enterobacter hormaechei]CAH5248407.1 hypothetical protein AI2865V1_1926 [Enterobacter cloacae]CZV27714.1 Uncharacterised protein [Enterobacter hormaechei]CZV28594.1 Uncharacterised protein [Enterobacter hormaechei]